MSNSVRPHRWQPTRLSRSWDSPGKNTGVGCHFLLQHTYVHTYIYMYVCTYIHTYINLPKFHYMCSCWELITVESISTEFRTMYKIVLIINHCIKNYTQTLWLTITIFIISALVGQEYKSLLSWVF